jgi:hypothetical protein
VDQKQFDELTRSLAAEKTRRGFLRAIGSLALGGSAALALPQRGEAAWSTKVCMPTNDGAYTLRLVPTSSVPLYQRRYGAVLPTQGACPTCQPDRTLCGGACIVGECCSGQPCVICYCLETASGGSICSTQGLSGTCIGQSVTGCSSDADCVGVDNFNTCALWPGDPACAEPNGQYMCTIAYSPCVP